MTIRNGSRSAGLRLPALLIGAMTVFSGSMASAQTVATVNGADIDSNVFDFYVQSRTQRQLAQVTAEERAILLEEITDIYLLATQDAAEQLRQEPQIKAQIELQIRSLLAQAVANDFVSNITITDEEIQAEYDSQAALAPPQQFKARHILVETQGEAKAIIGELDGGANFESLAADRSTGPSGPNGGDLGWFSPNQMVKPFSDAVALLEDGKYTAQPVQTDFGWHVILREDSRVAEAPPLDSVRETIVQALQNKKFQSYLEEIRSSATE